jgi:hypothetical protein
MHALDLLLQNLKVYQFANTIKAASCVVIIMETGSLYNQIGENNAQ